MEVISFVHEGLGNSSYLIPLSADGAVAAVDPDRSIDKYLRTAEERGLRLAAIFETHLHADFVTGSLDLSAATGAPVFAAEQAGVRFAHNAVRTGEEVRIEGATVESVASPGHTPEHTSYVFRWANGRPPALFSGGSLIVGGAARTDLISPDLTDELTRAQYRTLRQAFVALPDETLLYPTHGGGSFCSAGAAGERTSTLGRERAANPLLGFDDEEEFARWFPTTFPAIPDYFFRLRAVNQAGPRRRPEIADPPPFSPAEFSAASSNAAVVVDVRPVSEYMASHIPGSLSNVFRPSYAVWLGWLVPPQTPLLFVTGAVSAGDIVAESLLVGYEDFAGWLDGGIPAWERAGLPLRTSPIIEPAELSALVRSGAAVLDVREPGEYASGHIEDAIHLPLGSLEDHLDRVPKDRPLITYCGVGERSTTAISLLERAGFSPLSSLEGGFRAWREAGERVVA